MKKYIGKLVIAGILGLSLFGLLNSTVSASGAIFDLEETLYEEDVTIVPFCTPTFRVLRDTPFLNSLTGPAGAARVSAGSLLFSINGIQQNGFWYVHGTVMGGAARGWVAGSALTAISC